MIETPKGWRDYVLLDAGEGEKLEIWGDVKVIRPDPQAFWPKSYKWEKPDMHYHRSSGGGGSWQIYTKNTPEFWNINHKGLKFKIKPTGFKHMGLFPEQAANWKWMKERIESSERLINVLNLFAYTGGATVALLKTGAAVTHIDASKGVNIWARENVELSGLTSNKCRILTDDVTKFVKRELNRGNKYDAIIMDPPVFGRGPSGEMWKLNEKLYSLLELTSGLLSSNPLFFQVNAYTAGYSGIAFENILRMALKRSDGNYSSNEIGIESKSGFVLPCGMYARWTV